MEHKLKKGKVEGSVLLTVTSVMFVLVVFLMSTLTLTRAAQRRSYYTYFETQAQFAAQAALDSITQDAYSNSDFFKYVQDIDTPAKRGEVQVDFSATDIPVVDDVVPCEITYIGADYVWNSNYGRLETRNTWKITATATVGTGRNASSATVANYIHSSAGTGESVNLSRNEWSYSFDFTKQGDSNDTPDTSIDYKKIETQGVTTLAGGGGDNVSMFGTSYVGIYEFPAGRTKYSSDTTHQQSLNLANDNAQVGTTIFVGNGTGNHDYYRLKNGQGAVFMGNYTAGNEFGAFSINPNDSAPANYKDLPFFYVDGTISGQGIRIGLMKSNNPKHVVMSYDTDNNADTDAVPATPTNLYAGAINAQGDDNAIYGDAYLYDPELESYFKGGGETPLYYFVENNVHKANYAAGKNSYVGGNVISNNARFKVDGKFHIGGDLIFTNPSGTFDIATGETVKIDGAFVSAGNFEVSWNNPASMTVGKGFYVKPGSTYTCAAKKTLTVNGIQVTNNDGTAWDWDAIRKVNRKINNPAIDVATDTGTALTATIASLDIDASGATYDATYNDIADKAKAKYTTAAGKTYTPPTGYDFSLFPYQYRLDEINERYIRWDARQTKDTDVHGFATEAACDTFIASGYEGTQDPLISESIAAGHTWTSAVKYSTTFGKRYFPSTTPHQADNSFVPELTTVQRSDIQNTANTTYYDSYDKICAQFNSGQKFKYYNDGTTPIKVYSHNAEGTFNADSDNYSDIADAYVVNENCILYLGDGSMNIPAGSEATNTGNGTTATGLCGKTIFVDPTKGNHTAENPLVVCLLGGSANGKTTIIVNNTAEYTNDYKAPVPYATGSTDDLSRRHASRSDVVFYLMEKPDDVDSWIPAFNGNKLYMISSGAYRMYNVGADGTGTASAHGTIDFVEDVAYPGEAEWDALPEKGRDKYKFELIPNDIIYARKAASDSDMIYFSNSCNMTGALIAPTSNIQMGASGNITTISYRQAYTDTTETMTRELTWIGSVLANKFSCANVPLVLFTGSISSGSNTNPGESNPTSYSVKTGGSGENVDDNTASYFDNDHQAGG